MKIAYMLEVEWIYREGKEMNSSDLKYIFIFLLRESVIIVIFINEHG